MKKITLLIIICFLWSFETFAQDEADSTLTKHIIKIYPISYMLGGEVNISYERFTNKKFSYEIIAAWNYRDYIFIKPSTFLPFSFFSYSPTLEFHPSVGGSLRLNIKKYKNTSKPIGWYRSIQLMYKFTHFNNLSFRDDYYKENLNANKQLIAVKYLWGYHSRLPGKFVINYYFGFGMRVIFQKNMVFYSITENTETGELIEDFSQRNTSITMFTPTLHLGFGIAYIF